MKRTCILTCTLLLFTLDFLILPKAGLSMAVAAESAPTRKPLAKPGRQSPGQAPRHGAGDAGPAGAPRHDPGKQSSSDLTPGQVEARSAILVEVASGTTLFEQNADELIEPASFTKILTLFLLFEALKQGKVQLSDEVWVSETAWRTGGSKMFVGVGTKVPVEELVKGVAVVSGNDACVALAEHLNGSLETFVDAMNRKARELGMVRSHFLNPHGLPGEGQITTAREMAMLDTAYLQRFPESLRYHSMREYTYNNITQYNRNHLLLKDSSVDGLKTGFVDAGGYHLAATAQRDGMRLLAVVMGTERPAVREREALKLLNYGFRNFTMVSPFGEGKPAKTVKVWKGMVDQVDLFPLENASFTISQNQKQQLRWEIQAPDEITAPIQAGQALGQVVFFVGDQARRTVPLASRENVELGGWFKRTWQTVIRVDVIDWKLVGMISGGLFVVVLLVLFITSRRSRPRGSLGG